MRARPLFGAATPAADTARHLRGHSGAAERPNLEFSHKTGARCWIQGSRFARPGMTQVVSSRRRGGDGR
jgi:hypothetical protein